MTWQAQYRTNANNQTEFIADMQRNWIPGGLIWQAQYRTYGNNQTEYSADIQRIWVPGGLTWQAQFKTYGNSNSESIGDIFRIVGVTLIYRTDIAPLIRRVNQPPGVPWLQEEVTTAAWCWKLSLRDGTVFGFTNHDEDITLGGVTYEASTGFVPTAVETSNNMAVDNLEVEGFLDSSRIQAEDIATGRFDFAKVEVFLCNWRNTKDPLLVVRKGTTGQIKTGKYGFQAEVRGLLEAYQQSAGTVYQKSCRAKLGDFQCKIELSLLTTFGQVMQVNQNGTIQTNLSQSKGYFDYGVMTFNTGGNSGCQYEVKTFEDGLLTLFLPATFSVAIGDTFSITPGCDGNFSTCRKKFNNGMNFRGEPHIPGNDYQSAYPGQGSSNTVSEGSNLRRG
ncbi:DUF2163 domain-containing protein [Propionispora hippei]|uniref:DUF2163 domain-containing protein n=1 Tax=Propionispora hippei TaxID=209080 RepID=UPI001CB6B8F5|nr:DUF2163 domain-containing protein [Propionispora hippei]